MKKTISGQALPDETLNKVSAGWFAPSGAVDNSDALAFCFKEGAIVKVQERFTNAQRYARIKMCIPCADGGKYWPTYFVEFITGTGSKGTVIRQNQIIMS